MEGLIRCSANYVPLSPISFLERAAVVFGERPSVVYGGLRYTWKETLERCTKLASALSQLGISYGDVVATLLPNVPAMYELHFGVPMSGGVLCTLNTRHDSSLVSVLLRHSEAKLVFVDPQFLGMVHEALETMSRAPCASASAPKVVLVLDTQAQSVVSTMIPPLEEYESLLRGAKPGFKARGPKDEFDPITLNYTSGTTSSPKGVIYTHRGAYLNSLATALFNEMRSMPVYLWTVPMFHSNGWALVWGGAVFGATNVCLRNVDAKEILEKIAEHGVTHMGGAPTVLNKIINAPPGCKKRLPGKVVVMTGAAPPPPHVLLEMEEMGFVVVHAYGLTETYGAGTYCAWKPEWDALPPDARSRLKARQGVPHITLGEVDVKDPGTMESVPSNARTMGEVMFRGNTIMGGYLKDLKATEASFEGGWFRSGDLGVRHPDGYIELKDRSKDIIISGGENISTIEVESVLFSHPKVLEAAVVGRPDDYWGETPCAFVKLKDGNGNGNGNGDGNVSAEEIIEFCKERLPRYMAPRTVVFEELPKNSTGKIEKFALRERAMAMGSLFLAKGSKL